MYGTLKVLGKNLCLIVLGNAKTIPIISVFLLLFFTDKLFHIRNGINVCIGWIPWLLDKH